VSSSSPFAGLAPDARTLRGLGELSEIDLQNVIAVGARLRSAADSGVPKHTLAEGLVDSLHAFELDRRPACALVQAFVTCSYRELASDLQAELAAASGDHPPAADRTCLQVLATRSIDPDWTDREPRALLLADSASPLFVEIERQLQLGEPAQPPTGIFMVTDPVLGTSFSRSHDVKSVFGLAARAWPGETLLVVMFGRAAVDQNVLRMLELVAHHARAAWLRTRDASARLPPLLQSTLQAEALTALLVAQEIVTGESLQEQRAEVRIARGEARDAVERAAAEAELHDHELRRTQRAMLNVIEDLRSAREALESTVELRTRELAHANRKLASRNSELEEFVYIASHDLQEPLRTVSGYLQMIERRYGDKLGTEADEFIRFAIDGAQRMQALIESLLMYSRVTTTSRRFERLPLQEPLDSALRNLGLRIQDTRATIEVGELPTIRADRIQMVQLFQNLLSNALKFAGDRPPRVQVSARIDGEVCRIQVRDWGIGFQPKFADRIFKVFRRLRRDTEGTGIGLAVCKKIAERHGGRIMAESTPGQGATFTVELAAEHEDLT